MITDKSLTATAGNRGVTNGRGQLEPVCYRSHFFMFPVNKQQAMKSAVIINLDYKHHSATTCRRIWEELVHRMEMAGFSQHLRLFLAETDQDTASKRAKRIVAETEDALAAEGVLVFDVIREFYCFEYQQINDLLALANEIPEVNFLDTGSFPAFVIPGAH